MDNCRAGPGILKNQNLWSTRNEGNLSTIVYGREPWLRKEPRLFWDYALKALVQDGRAAALPLFVEVNLSDFLPRFVDTQEFV